MGDKTLPGVSQDIPLPIPTRINGRLYFSRIAIETYKARILAAATGGEPIVRAAPAIDELVPAAQVAREFGFGRRTLGRRLRECQAETVGADQAVA